MSFEMLLQSWLKTLNPPLFLAAYSKKKAELMAARERKVVEKKALQDAQRQKIADAMAANYLDWHQKVRLALLRKSNDLT